MSGDLAQHFPNVCARCLSFCVQRDLFAGGQKGLNFTYACHVRPRTTQMPKKVERTLPKRIQASLQLKKVA